MNKSKELEDRVNLMKDCYFKGFGNKIQAILANTEPYLWNPKEKKWKQAMLKHLKTIQESYKSIPFDKLNSNSDFAPLFVVKDLFPKYGRNIKELISNPKEELIEKIQELSGTIVDIGRVYEGNFNRRIKELRQMPGYENFKVILKDYNGHQFMK